MTRHATLLFTSSRGLGSLKARYLYCNTRKRIFNSIRDVYGGRIESMADSVCIAARLVCNRAPEPFRINASEILQQSMAYKLLDKRLSADSIT